MAEKWIQTEGVTGGFHYGTSLAPCNGVLHATLETHFDGRQIFMCDACGAQTVRNWKDEKTFRMQAEGITEEDIEETRNPTCWPENR